MKVSVEKLRWGIAGAVVLLVVGLLALVSYGRWAAARKWKDILARNGIHITQESDNVTYSQTLQGRTVFTIRAKKAIPISNGKYTLRGVTLLLYGKTPDKVDRVEGDEFEYDEKAGVAKAIGEVHMDIQAPGALKHKPPGSQETSGTAGTGAGQGDLEQKADVIHVLTSGLVYVRKLGVAATDQRVEFRYEGMTCMSKGAEFGTTDNSLHLLADVMLTGELHGRPAVIRAARADLDRNQNTITVLQPVASTTAAAGKQSARADHAILLLGPDGSVQHADATGGVLLQTAERRVSAQRMQAVFGPQNVPQSAVLSGGVALDGSAARPMHGTAAEADLGFTTAGALKTVLAKGGVRVSGSVLHPGSPALAREMRGDKVSATFQAAARGKQTSLQEVHALGGAFVRSEAFATAKPGAKPVPGGVTSGIVATQVTADDLLAAFAPPAGKANQAVLQHLTGRGHTRLQQGGLNGAEEVSSADTLEAVLVPDTRPNAASAAGGSFRLQSAVQEGHVQIRGQGATVASTQGSKPGPLSVAHGTRASFDAATDRLTLSGGAAFQQAGTSLSANSLVVEQGTGNAEAQGSVEATMEPEKGDATHVLADRAKLTRTAQTAEFFGTDAHPARMWQAGSQVMAANLFLDDVHQSLAARPGAQGGAVEAVFAAAARKAGAKAPPGGTAKAAAAKERVNASSGESVHVSARALDYSGLRHEVVCSGGVRMRQEQMQARAQQAVVFLSGTAAGAKADAAKLGGMEGAGQLGGTLERMVLSGAVRLDEDGRAGEGEQLVYTAIDASYLLTGTAAKPPRVADAEQGMVTGPALLFRTGEKSVIVDGAGASNGQKPGSSLSKGRVHTDVAVRPQD